MSRRDESRLRHMLDAAEKAVRRAEGRSVDDLVADEDLLLVLTRLLEILGEAAKNVPASIRDANPGVPWREIARTRDRVIHRYFDVDHEMIWKIVSEELPPLIPQLARILAEESEGSS